MNGMMNQRRSEPFLLFSKCNGSQSEVASSASLFCNFSVCSLFPSVDFDAFNEAHFGHQLKEAESLVAYNKPGENFVKYLSAELIAQSRLFQSREQSLDTKVCPVVIRRGGARRLPLKVAQVSLGNSYKSNTRRITMDDMIKTGKVHNSEGAKPAIDIPEASTSGRVGGEFWSERRRGRNFFNYLPLGTLYYANDDDDVRKYWGLPQGKTVEEDVRIDQNHSVSTGFQQGMQLDERSIWLSTSHKFGAIHGLATQYADDLKGGNNFNINTTHNCIGDSTLSTNLCTSSSGDYSFEVELQREKKQGNQEVLESIMTNFRTGERLLKLQEKKVLKNIVFLNSIISDLRDMHALRFMATVPLRRSGFLSSSLATDLQGNQKLCLNAVQKIHDQIMIGACFNTNLKQEDSASLEGKHQLNGRGHLELKFTNYYRDAPKWDITTSLTTKENSWLCTYRNSRAEGHSLGCQWRYEASPDQFFSIRAEAKNSAWGLCSELAVLF